MPGDVPGTPALGSDTIFLRLVEQTEDFSVNVTLGDLMCKFCGPITPTGRLTTSHPEFDEKGGYSNITGGYCIGRRANKQDSPSLPSALSSRVLSRTHVKVVVDPNGALWLMDLKSLHGTAVGRGIRTFTLEAYAPFRLEDGDLLILGKNVASRDGVTHLPLRLRVHYTFIPPMKSAIPYLPVSEFAENLTDIKLPPFSATRGWGIPITYESEHEEDLAEHPPHDKTLSDDGDDSIVCMGTPKPVKIVLPVHDDDADSVVFTGSTPSSSQIQNAVSQAQATPRTVRNSSTCRRVYPPQESAATRESILAMPLYADEMGGDDLAEHSYGGDRVSEHSQDECDGVSDDEHHHHDYLDDEAEEAGSDEGSISDEQRMDDYEIEDYDDDISEVYHYRHGEFSDSADDVSDSADDEEHQGVYERDIDLHSQPVSDEEAEDEDEDEVYWPFAVAPFLLRLVDRDPTPFYFSPSPPNPTIIPSSMPEEESFTRSMQGATAPVDEAVNQIIDAEVEAVERLEAHEAIKVEEPPLTSVIKNMPCPEEGDTEVLVSPSEYNTLPPIRPVVHGLRRPSTDSADSPSPDSSLLYSPRGSPNFLPTPPIHVSQPEEEEADAEATWDEAQRPNVRNLVIVPDEIEEPRLDEAEDSDDAMETAPSMPVEAIYSLPPSPPASTGSPNAESEEPKIKAVASTVPATPPSPAYKVLAPETPNSDAYPSTPPSVTKNAGSNTTAATPRKRKLSVLEDETPTTLTTPGTVTLPTDTPPRPTRRRRIGTFVKGVALGVSLGVVSTFGALYQLGAE